jgi:plastocyanin
MTASGSYVYACSGIGTLMIADVSNPSSPVVSSTLDLGSVGYALAVSGTHLLVAQGTVGFKVIDVSNPAAPAVVGYLDTPGTAKGVAVSGSYAFVADGDLGLETIDITNPAAPVLVGGVGLPGPAISVVVSGSFAYASASGSGLQVVDISNPLSPLIVGSHPIGGRMAASGGYVYVARGENGFSILDVTNPASPTIVGNVHYPYWTDYISVSGSLVFSTGWGGSSLLVFDVSDPAYPVLAWWEALRYGPCGPNAVVGSHAYAMHSAPADFPRYLAVVDIHNPAAIAGGFGTGGEEARETAISGSYAFVAASANGLAYADVSNPAAPANQGYLDTPGDARGVAVSGSYAYVADYDTGLRIIDISVPGVPAPAGDVDTPGQAWKVRVSGAGAYAYVADGTSGIQVVDVSNPASPAIVGAVDTPGDARNLVVQGSLAYVADYGAGLQVVDISNPLSPALLGGVDTPGHALDVFLWFDRAYVCDDNYTLQVVDVSNPSAPAITGDLYVYGRAMGATISGAVAYIACNLAGVCALDLSNPESPVLIHRVDTSDGAVAVAASGANVYVPEGLSGLEILRPHCTSTSPVIQNPGPQSGEEFVYSSTVVTATHPLEDDLVISLVGPVPAWLTFSDLGGGTAWLRGTPGAGEAGTYPILIAASVPTALDTASFDIVIDPAPPPPPTSAVIALDPSGFTPNLTAILPGGYTVWRYEAHGPHTTTNGTGPLDPAAGTLWDAPLSTQSTSWSYQFPNPGTYPYFCRNHPSETGVVEVTTGQVGIGDGVDSRFSLVPASNPFRNSVALHFDLDRPERVHILIFDLQGHRVRDLLFADMAAGPHEVTWTGRNENLQPAPPGMYLVRLTTEDGRSLSRKLLKTR